MSTPGNIATFIYFGTRISRSGCVRMKLKRMMIPLFGYQNGKEGIWRDQINGFD